MYISFWMNGKKIIFNAILQVQHASTNAKISIQYNKRIHTIASQKFIIVHPNEMKNKMQ